jgi:hypothetical protein
VKIKELQKVLANFLYSKQLAIVKGKGVELSDEFIREFQDKYYLRFTRSMVWVLDTLYENKTTDLFKLEHILKDQYTFRSDYNYLLLFIQRLRLYSSLDSKLVEYLKKDRAYDSFNESLQGLTEEEKEDRKMGQVLGELLFLNSKRTSQAFLSHYPTPWQQKEEYWAHLNAFYNTNYSLKVAPLFKTSVLLEEISHHLPAVPLELILQVLGEMFSYPETLP